MASEWVMYISVLGLGVLLIAGVTLTFNNLNNNTIENNIEIGLLEINSLIAKELKTIFELGVNSDPNTPVTINRTLSLPTDLSGHQYRIEFTITGDANHWIIVGSDITDNQVDEVRLETSLAWRSVSLFNKKGTGLPTIQSNNFQHYLSFIRTAGTSIYKIYIW